MGNCSKSLCVASGTRAAAAVFDITWSAGRTDGAAMSAGGKWLCLFASACASSIIFERSFFSITTGLALGAALAFTTTTRCVTAPRRSLRMATVFTATGTNAPSRRRSIKSSGNTSEMPVDRILGMIPVTSSPFLCTNAKTLVSDLRTTTSASIPVSSSILRLNAVILPDCSTITIPSSMEPSAA